MDTHVILLRGPELAKRIWFEWWWQKQLKKPGEFTLIRWSPSIYGLGEILKII